MEGLNTKQVQKIVAAALKEDLGKGDITSAAIVPESMRGLALIFAQEEGVLAGSEVARIVFEAVDPAVEFTVRMRDGERFERGAVVATVMGSSRTCLAGERTALNFLQRLSGIATLTRRFVEAVAGTQAVILDTRKTTPGMRILEKYAVRVGGGANHRQGLFDMILIKDNHIQLIGSVTQAVQLALAKRGRRMLVEVEVKTINELREALALGVDRIMLDNMNVRQIAEAVQITAGRVKLEASGGIALDNVAQVAGTGVDYISVGELTHSAPALNLNMKIKSIG